MSQVVALKAAADLDREIRRHLRIEADDSLVLIEGEDFVLVKKAARRSPSERFSELADRTQTRLEALGLNVNEVENAVRWARESS